MADYFGFLGGLDQIGAIIDYLLLTGTFIYGFFRPKGNTEWLVVSSNTYVVLLIMMMFLAALIFAMGMFIPDLLASVDSTAMMVIAAVTYIPTILIFLYVILSIVRSRIQIQSPGFWQISFVLYVFSLGLELFSILNASIPKTLLIEMDLFQLKGFWILGWYVAGAFLVTFGGEILGSQLDRMFPEASARHIPDMKKLFGEGAPVELRFKDGSYAKGNFTPGVCAGMGILYSLWMLVRFILLP